MISANCAAGPGDEALIRVCLTGVLLATFSEISWSVKAVAAFAAVCAVRLELREERGCESRVAVASFASMV